MQNCIWVLSDGRCVSFSLSLLSLSLLFIVPLLTSAYVSGQQHTRGRKAEEASDGRLHRNREMAVISDWPIDWSENPHLVINLFIVPILPRFR